MLVCGTTALLVDRLLGFLITAMSSHRNHEHHHQLESGDAGRRAVQRARPRGGIRRQKAHHASAGQVHGRCRSTLLYRPSRRPVPATASPLALIASPGACRARFVFRLPGALAVGILKTAISARERRRTHTEVPSSAGLAGRLTPGHDTLSPTAGGADEQDNGRPPPPRSESGGGLGADAVLDLTVCSTLGAAILGLRAIWPAGAATAGQSCRRGKHVPSPA